MTAEFTLEVARAVLASVRALAPDTLAVPLSRRDLRALATSGIEAKDMERGLLDFP